MSNHRVRAIMSRLTTNKNVNLIKGRRIVLDKWSNCWLTWEERGQQIWLVAWRQHKETWWDHNLDCLLYLKSEPFLFIHWKQHILSHRSWRQHTCSTHVTPVSASSAHGLCPGFMTSPNQMLNAHPWWRALAGRLRFAAHLLLRQLGCPNSSLVQ